MANDYHLFIVDWEGFAKHFKSSSLGVMDENRWSKLTHDERSQETGNFLGCLWESDFSTPLSEMSRFHGASGSFKLWCAFAATYSEIRSFLPEEEREVYDELYLPFCGPYMQGEAQRDHPFELPAEFKSRLEVGGLYLAISPERTAKMYKAHLGYSFSRLVHETLAFKTFPPPLPGCASHFHDMLDGADTDLGRLHQYYTEMSEGWRIVAQQASFRKWGVVATYDI
ncbi:hypothetical protein [Roseimicrobium sp. ORNL1]|uniref:hypothetical protein n=1 Tax=Roseimicrobium sp. ORNL1 TaxID=2711231 RepID=UPI0013E0FBB9|nr:hypothetical protein [Roseimicrobium sp. ORNL1]QIF03328.1 hypothetical protein G5S37_17965 [Roseimicrobium sp. ORNL1]